MHRFFIGIENIQDGVARIFGEDVYHINKVLRLKSSDEIVLCDGLGKDYLGEIIDIDKDEVTVKIKEERISEGESDIYIKVYQGVPKSDKMDIIIQKSTEIGVKEIIPLTTIRTVSKIEKGKKEEKKLQRWQKIAESAAKQSRRGIVPKIQRIISFKELLEELKEEELYIVFFENEKQSSFKQLLRKIKNNKIKKISLIIGPEGGFEEEEIDKLLSNGVKSVSLGKRILRTETVSLVASTIIMYEIGDLAEI